MAVGQGDPGTVAGVQTGVGVDQGSASLDRGRKEHHQ